MLWWCKTSALLGCSGAIPKEHRLVGNDESKKLLLGLIDMTNLTPSLGAGEGFSNTKEI
jgi:hypothetical protein